MWGGAALIVNIKHYEMEKYVTEHLKATRLIIEDRYKTVKISTITGHSMKQSKHWAINLSLVMIITLSTIAGDQE